MTYNFHPFISFVSIFSVALPFFFSYIVMLILTSSFSITLIRLNKNVYIWETKLCDTFSFFTGSFLCIVVLPILSLFHTDEIFPQSLKTWSTDLIWIPHLGHKLLQFTPRLIRIEVTGIALFKTCQAKFWCLGIVFKFQSFFQKGSKVVGRARMTYRFPILDSIIPGFNSIGPILRVHLH